MNKFTASVAACNFVFLVRKAQKKKLKTLKIMRFRDRQFAVPAGTLAGRR